MIDPNPDIRGKGILFLQQKGIETEFFPYEYLEKVKKLNDDFLKKEWKKYRIDVMKDFGSEYEKYEKCIEIEFYDFNSKRIKMFEVLKKRCKEEEIKNLCEIYLSINYQDLEGETKSGKIRELIGYCERKQSIETLLQAIKNFNINIWKEINN